MRPRRSEINPAPSSSHQPITHPSIHPSMLSSLQSFLNQLQGMRSWGIETGQSWFSSEWFLFFCFWSKGFFVSITSRTNQSFLDQILQRSLYLAQDYHAYHLMWFLNVKILSVNIWPWLVFDLFVLFFLPLFLQAHFIAMWLLHEVFSRWWPIMKCPAMSTWDHEDYLTECLALGRRVCCL